MKHFPHLILPALMAVGLTLACSTNSSDNRTLDYQSMDLSFAASIKGLSFTPDDRIGVYTPCTRGDRTEVPMSTSFPCIYQPLAEGSDASLVATDEWISTLKGDHNFFFASYFPCDDASASPEALPANVPSVVQYTAGAGITPLCVVSRKAAKVLGPIGLSFRPICAIARLSVADNIVNLDGGTVLKSMVLRPHDDAAFSGAIAYNATYNLLDNTLSPDEDTKSNTITVDFGEGGYLLPAGMSDISFLIAPFTVPAEGFDVVFTDIEGNETVSRAWENNVGKNFAAGELVTASFKPEGIVDVIPCNPPVKWSVGYKNGAPLFTKQNQPLWPQVSGKIESVSDHIWTGDQVQSSIQYYFGEEHPADWTILFENNQFSQYNYASPCIKGIWTGDYFEFTIPVKDFKANTTVTLTIPSYNRGGPVFWDVEYLDGGAWRCNRTLQESPDGQFSKECTLVIPHGNEKGAFEGVILSTDMTFSKSIKSGYMLIRLTCADGAIITSGGSTYTKTCTKIDKPGTSNPFAFVNKSGACDAISVNW